MVASFHNRVPGLTPSSQERLCRMLATDESLAGLGLDDAAFRRIVATVAEAMPHLPGAVSSSTLVHRLQAISDELRREGRVGMGQDIDKLAGILLSLTSSQAPQAVEAPVPMALAAGT